MRRLAALAAAALLAGCGEDEPGFDVEAAERGAKLFSSNCSACHSVREDHRVGPGLAGIYGRIAGSAPGFEYSAALRAADFAWSDETLAAFLSQGEEFLPGVNMVITPLSESEARDVVEYLKQRASGG